MCLSMSPPADILLICLSVALNVLWKVECWACSSVSLDTALDLFRSKDFPFAHMRNVFWGIY